jgi:hypothetical protein
MCSNPRVSMTRGKIDQHSVPSCLVLASGLVWIIFITLVFLAEDGQLILIDPTLFGSGRPKPEIIAT